MRIKWIVLSGLIIILLAACSGTGEQEALPSLDAVALEETAIHQATLDAAQTAQAEPTQTPAPTLTQTLIPTIDRTRPIIQTPTPEKPCDQAAAGHPFDVTIPDGTVMSPGESFSKTWRLVNAGSCTWTRQYAVSFFSSNSMNAFQVNLLQQEVRPGEVIDVTVNMEAPDSPGIYQGNWMLRNAQGELFGIGPNGDAPFWVKIEVVPSITETPYPTPTITSTPMVYLTGEVELADNDQFDLDSDEKNPADITLSDFVYRRGEGESHVLTTMNGTVWKVFEGTKPTFGECSQANLKGTAISFTDDFAGTYICYQTSEAFPGRLSIEQADSNGIYVNFITWSIP